MAENLCEFIDESLRNGSNMEELCRKKLLRKRKSMERIQNCCIQLNNVIVDLTLNNVGGPCAMKSCLLYDGLIYKFSSATRHQKFWKNALQVNAELKRVNHHNLLDYLKRFVKALEEVNFRRAPCNAAVYYLGSLLMERIIRLDRLRIYCFRTANACMGYVELQHHLTLNLMLIAISSDIAKEALMQIRHLISIYDTLANWIRTYSERFPSSSSDLPLVSMRDEYLNPMRSQKLEEVRAIIRLLNLNELESGLETEDFDERLRNVNAIILKALQSANQPKKRRQTCKLIDAPKKIVKQGMLRSE